MRRALLLLLGALLPACTTPGTQPSVRLRADSTAAFPTTWDGRRTDPQELAERRRLAATPGATNSAASTEQTPAAPPELRIKGNQLVAVLQPHSKLKGSDVEALDAAYFGDQVRAGIQLQVPSVRMITRENVLVILQAAGKTLEDCEGECEVETGRHLGADLIISGELIRVGSKLKLDLRLHDTHSGQLLSGATAEGKSVDALDADLARA